MLGTRSGTELATLLGKHQEESIKTESLTSRENGITVCCLLLLEVKPRQQLASDLYVQEKHFYNRFVFVDCFLFTNVKRLFASGNKVSF